MLGIRQSHGERPEEMPDADSIQARAGEGPFSAVPCAFCGPTVSSDIHSHVPILRVLPPRTGPPVLSHGSSVPGISLLSSMETGEGRPEREGLAPFSAPTRNRGSPGTVGSFRCCRSGTVACMICCGSTMHRLRYLAPAVRFYL